nr:uncharacterized protein LOC106690806 [Halyomorpha halys]
MKFLLLFYLFLHTSLAAILVNDYFDEVLKQFVSDVVQGGDDVIPLAPAILEGGFLFTAPKMKNLSSLKRVGDATLQISFGPIFLTTLSFGELVIEGEKIDGPKTYLQPKITVRNNTLRLQLEVSLNRSNQSCTQVVSSTGFYQMRSVWLNGMLIDDWLTQVSFYEYFTIPLKNIFSKYFNFCKALSDHNYKLFLPRSG